MIVSGALEAMTPRGSAASSSRGVTEGTTARIDDSASSIEKEVRLRSMRLGLENVGRGFAAARGWGPDDDKRASHSHSSSGATNRGLNGDHAGTTTLSSAPEAKSLAAGQGSSRAVPGVERANAGNPPASITARSGAAAPCDGDDDARFGASDSGRGGSGTRGDDATRAAGFCADTDAQTASASATQLAHSPGEASAGAAGMSARPALERERGGAAPEFERNSKITSARPRRDRDSRTTTRRPASTVDARTTNFPAARA